MSSLGSYLCLGGLEVGNRNRFLAYVQNVVSVDTGHWDIRQGCSCDALDQTDDYDAVVPYEDPAFDNAPWYDPNRPESEEFLGFDPASITLGNPISRTMGDRLGVGATLGYENLRQRVVSVKGVLAASTPAGMYYGERWLYTALRGCCGCDGDTLTLLSSCPDTAAGQDSIPYFRHLVNVGLIDYVPPTSLGELPECFIQEVAFQLASEKPYLYSPAEEVLDSVLVGAGGSECGLTTTDIWPGDATLRIIVRAPYGDASDITVTARPSFNDTCPPDHGGSPCWTYRITDLEMDSRLTIDGRSESVAYYDPALKMDRNGYPLIDPYVSDRQRGDLFKFPHMDACTTLAVEVINDGAEDIEVTVERYDRSI